MAGHVLNLTFLVGLVKPLFSQRIEKIREMRNLAETRLVCAAIGVDKPDRKSALHKARANCAIDHLCAGARQGYSCR